MGRQHNLADVQRELAELNRDRDWWSVDTKADVRDWLAESHDLAKSFAYDPVVLEAVRATPPGAKVPPVTLSDEYLKAAGQHARERIVAAGKRLATVLEQ